MIELLEQNLVSLTESFPLLPIKRYKELSLFPIYLFVTTMTPPHKNLPTIHDLYNAKGVYGHLVYL